MTKKKLLRNCMDILRWKSIFDLLSMDIIDLKIAKAMGLEINEKELVEIRKIARAFFEYYWLDRSQDNMSDKKYETEQELYMQKFFSQLSDNLNLERAKWFYNWGINYFPWDGPEGEFELRWDLIFSNFPKSVFDVLLPPLSSIPKDKVGVIIEALKENNNRYEYASEIREKLKKKTKTTWDECVIQTYEPEHSPFTGVFLQFLFHDFQIAWKQIEESLNKKELEIILQWGEKIEVWDVPGPLKLPTVLKIE